MVGGRRRRDRARHAVLRPDGRRPGDPEGRASARWRTASACAGARRSCASSATQDATTPVVLMGYANPIERYGIAALRRRTRAPPASTACSSSTTRPRSAPSSRRCSKARGIDPIFLLAPTSTDARIARRRAGSRSGYVYYVSLKGVTGAGHIDIGAVAAMIPRIRRAREAAGRRRLRHPRRRRPRGRSAEVADAVVIGSALVQRARERRARDEAADSGRAIHRRDPRRARRLKSLKERIR